MGIVGFTKVVITEEIKVGYYPGFVIVDEVV
jgi:hypothetical protein